MKSPPTPGKTARTLNVPLLIVSLVVLSVSGTGAYFWHARQMVQIAGALLDRADQLEKEEDWAQASTCLYRYLQLRPAVLDVHIRLAQTFDRSATSAQEKARATDLYLRAVGIAPYRVDLRGRLTELLLEVERYRLAQDQAEALLELQPRSPIGLRVRALAVYAQSRNAGPASLQEALNLVTMALEACPERIDLVEVLMNLCQDLARTPGDADRERHLATAFDRLIEASPDDAEAYLARYRYRVQFGLNGAGADLHQALQLAPDSPLVLRTAGEDAQRRNALGEARDYFSRIVGVAPNQPSGFLGLGDSYLALGQIELALETWRQGLAAVAPGDPTLNLRIADTLIQQQRLDEAHAALDLLDKTIPPTAMQDAGDNSFSYRTAVDLLYSKWHLAKGNQQAAIPLLKRALFAEQSRSDGGGDLQSHAWLLLGTAYAETKQWDLAAPAFERAAQMTPTASTLLATAKSWAAAGQITPALRHCEALLKLDSAPQEAWLLWSQLLLEQELRTSKKHRNWQPLRESLAKAESVLPNSWELQLVKADFTLAQANEPPVGQALEILQAAEFGSPQSPEMYEKLVIAYERLGRPDEADRALERWEARDGKSLASCLRRAEMLFGRREFAAVRIVLSDALATASKADRKPLVYALVRLERQLRNFDRARQHLADLAKSAPADLEPLRQLTELAFEAGNFADAEYWENNLRQVEGQDGCYWQLYRAQRLIAQARGTHDPRFSEALSLQSRIESQRPSWADNAVLKAMIAECQQRTSDAIDAYQVAFRLGSRRTFVYERIVGLLYGAQRFDEAYELLSRVEGQIPYSQSLSALAINLAFQRGEHDRALALARDAVHFHAKDPLATIRLAQALLRVGRTAEAEKEFQQAVRLEPAEARAWAGLLLYYVHTKQPARAREILGAMPRYLKLPEADMAFVLGQGYALIDDRKQAESYYRTAERLAPQSAEVKRELASLLLTRDPDEAQRLLREALRIAPGNHDTQRKLAVLLATQPDQKAWREANSLLEYSAPGDRADPASMRLQAAILTRRGRTDDLEKARHLLEALVGDPRTVISEDRLNLAKICETLGDLSAARQQLKSEASQDPNDTSRWIAYLDFLLRHKDLNEADQWLNKLEAAAPRDLTTLDMRTRWLQAAGRAEEIETLIEPHADSQLATLKQPPETQQFIQGIAAIYSNRGQRAAAERWLRRLAEDFPDQYAPLVRWLVQQQRVDEAADLCLQAVQSDKSARAATLLAEVLLSAGPEMFDQPSVESVLHRAVEQHATDSDLLFAVSNIRLLQQRLDDAAVLLQRVTELRSDNFLAWNNLAAILAERPGEHQRALQCIDRAIGLAGRPIASLSDTKAHILVQQGKLREAIALLEEVVAAPDGNDPRFHLHLSIAYERFGAAEKARAALEKARELGLSKNYLTPLEKDQLANLATRLAL